MRRISPNWRSSSAKRESIAAQRRLRVGIGRKGDQRRKTGAAFPAVPNVTHLLVAPMRAQPTQYRFERNASCQPHHQYVALTTTQSVAAVSIKTSGSSKVLRMLTSRDPHSPPRPAIIVRFKSAKLRVFRGQDRQLHSAVELCSQSNNNRWPN